ncbi:DUF2970 domain-containing protein [Gammaproteobacteria bacterium]|nr:DUF2970 domain-containing protein [Gammaproteobacteria bacterium]
MSKNKLSLVRVIFSILASFIGVQSSKNRERDFKSNNPVYFIVTGIIMTIIFIISLYLIVKLVVP